ncbi:MAG: hypothetical protein ACO1N9_01205 [Flavobacterium sp.]
MTTLDLLIMAIKNRNTVSFKYNKVGKIAGERFGQPHAVFIMTTKGGVKSTKVHLVQTHGVSDSKDINPFPDFRMFNIEELSEIIIQSTTFDTHHHKYNPEWEGYCDVIEKI